MPNADASSEFPNQLYGWRIETDGTWSLYSDTGERLISTTATTVSIPSLPGGSVSVTDGTHTVSSAAVVDFTSGATVTAAGSTAQVAVNGGSLPANWCTVTLNVPANPLTVGAPEHNFTAAEMSIHAQSGTDFSVADDGFGGGAVFSAAGGRFACGAYIGNPADASLDGGHFNPRYLEFAATIGDEVDLAVFGIDMFVPILTVGTGLGNIASCASSTEGIASAGGKVVANIQAVLVGGIGTDSVPLDDVFGFQMLVVWQTG